MVCDIQVLPDLKHLNQCVCVCICVREHLHTNEVFRNFRFEFGFWTYFRLFGLIFFLVEFALFCFQLMTICFKSSKNGIIMISVNFQLNDDLKITKYSIWEWIEWDIFAISLTEAQKLFNIFRTWDIFLDKHIHSQHKVYTVCALHTY